MIGQRFGLLVIVGPAPSPNYRRWIVRCDCGEVRQVAQNNLRAGKSKSCGRCIRLGPKGTNYKHGQSETPLFKIWLGIRQRCTNPRAPAYPRYGGRGIKLCAQWAESFETFAADVGPRPSDAHEIDRIDNNGNYEPGNVRWATASEQARNRRSNRLVTYDGQTKCLAEWAEVTGLSSDLLKQRLDLGWDFDRVFKQPHQGWGPGQTRATHAQRVGGLYTPDELSDGEAS